MLRRLHRLRAHLQLALRIAAPFTLGRLLRQRQRIKHPLRSGKAAVQIGRADNRLDGVRQSLGISRQRRRAPIAPESRRQSEAVSRLAQRRRRDEMRAADNCAKERDIPVAMVDRPIQVTLRRAWAVNSFWGKCKLISALLASAFDKEEVSGEQIENLKNSSEMDSMMKELADYMPVVKKVLIDERDRYLASKIWDCKGKKTLAVLGAGHLPGVEAYLKELAAGKTSSDVSDISEVPPKKVGSKIAGWTIAALIVALIAAGFVYGGITKGAQLLGAWVLWNSALAGLGTILAFGHPLAVLTAIVGAPFTSLCPLVGVGLFTGLVQATFCKPKVSDMETLQDDLTLKGFYKNRILRVLLVFFLSSLGSSIGTFAAGANFAVVIAEFVKGLFKK